ncbi:Enoyl-CoA hydratase/isomerase [Streptomyces atratus]|uniref:Enoyl-CoA hydratase/isomerase n=1 Tax=Streptomyces atratus TaxID=1893 RepID=A0A1K2F691_STRAR|nr:Enoyl-CoA hydratase/isomerase [Streptomyces atratus]
MSEQSAVRIERDGAVFTVILSRPGVRNAVDGPTASQLADAFREFDEDPDASVTVLGGEGGTFCAGADLKGIGTERGNKVLADGAAPRAALRSSDVDHQSVPRQAPAR